METGHSSSNNNPDSHNIGRLCTLVQENDKFFDLISSKFLSDSRYTISVHAAAARVILSCSLTWAYHYIFDDDVLEHIKKWVLDDSGRYIVDDNEIWKRQFGENKPSDFDMRIAYSTGLLAVSSDSKVVEDILTPGLSAKLMRYLRNRVLGETSTSQKDTRHVAVAKNASLGGGRGRDESRGRFRQTVDVTAQADFRIHEDGSLAVQVGEQVYDKTENHQVHGEEDGVSWEPYDVDIDGEHEGKLKIGELRDNDFNESLRDDPSRRRGNHTSSRHMEKVRANESRIEAEPLTSHGSGRSGRGRSSTRNIDEKRVTDSRKGSTRIVEGMTMEREDNNVCFQECRVGNKDVSDLVKSAVRAAEAEARAAHGPTQAVKAAGDAAAELVKSAAMDEFKATKDEEAAFMAASRAASTVIDAANAIVISRCSIGNVPPIKCEGGNAIPKTSATEPEVNDDVVEFFIPDSDSLAQQREMFCIQCLGFLGEYVEVLGPVLHEKGVDVCIGLLHIYSNDKKELGITSFLPDVLKLISALVAHKKFAAMFVDRGGIQKLLATPRVSQTFCGLSSCLFTIGSLQGIMEHVCAFPSDTIYQLVELGLQLLNCPLDHARKSSALFFTSAFVFRAIIVAFDAQDGLQKLLGLLHDVASVRSGVTSGTMEASSGTLRNQTSNAKVLTSFEKQIAYHTCVSLRQYFRAQLLLLVDTLRPSKSNQNSALYIPSIRAVYKPLETGNESMDAIFLQIQKDRKLGAALARARWTAVDRFVACNGHVTMLELCQAPPVDRYLHDLIQFALGILHIVTVVPCSRKLIVNATISNDRVGIAVILDAVNGPGCIYPDITEQALNVLINLVCPPPSISNKSLVVAQGQHSVSVPTFNAPGTETRDRNSERNISDRAVSVPCHNEPKEQNCESSTSDRGNTMQWSASSLASGLVGDCRISLGNGAGCAGLAAQLEHGYRQEREAVRANNGIKVLLQLLQTHVVMPPAILNRLRALACRALLGLARDDTIAHILTKLQVGKKLSEVIRDIGSHTPGTEQNRWKTEFTQAAIELIAIVTNSGRASTLSASDAATTTLRRIERAAIAAATPITYHPTRELLPLIHEHLQACGLSSSASSLLKEAQLTPLPSLSAPASLGHHDVAQEAPTVQIQWPFGRSPGGFLQNRRKSIAQSEHLHSKCDSSFSAKKGPLIFPSSFSSCSKSRPSTELQPPSISKTQSGLISELTVVDDSSAKTPIILLTKRKLAELKEVGPASSAKRLNSSEYGLKSPIFHTPNTVSKGSLVSDVLGFSTPNSSANDLCCDHQPLTSERLTLDSIVVQYLKHQHRQCPAPITTLPLLSLLQPHVCPEPQRSLDAPSNVTARLGTREFKSVYGGIHGSRKDRQFVYSRFRPWRTYGGNAPALLTCLTFLGKSSQFAAGGRSGELKIFDTNNNNILETCTSHRSPVILVQSYPSKETRLVLSSSSLDVNLWDATSISGGPLQSFDGCWAARFSHSGTHFSALPTESQREILLYDVQTYQLEQKLSYPSSGVSGRGNAYSPVHFSPLDDMLMWNGVLWDRRTSCHVHQFEQFTDYGGGGFHPAGNEVIINSEVWDPQTHSWGL